MPACMSGAKSRERSKTNTGIHSQRLIIESISRFGSFGYKRQLFEMLEYAKEYEIAFAKSTEDHIGIGHIAQYGHVMGR